MLNLKQARTLFLCGLLLLPMAYPALAAEQDDETSFHPVLSLELTRTPEPHSAIYLTLDFGEPRTVHITDLGDRALLNRLFGQGRIAVFDDPICSFDRIKISFVNGEDRVDFFPAADDCPLIRYGDEVARTGRIFELEPEEAEQLTRLWRKYDTRDE